METCIYFMDEECESSDENELLNIKNNVEFPSGVGGFATVTFAYEDEVKHLSSSSVLSNGNLEKTLRIGVDNFDACM